MAVMAMNERAITDEQRLSFETNGYLVLPDAVSPAELAELRNAADRVEAEWRADTSRPGWRRESINQIPNPIAYDDALLDLLAHPRIFPVVRDLLGPDVAMMFTDYYITPPRSQAHIHWHHDVGLIGPYHPLSTMYVKAFILLSDVTIENGPTAVIPGSHKFLDDFELPEPDDPEEMPGMVPMAFPAGYVWLFNARCYHAAMPNRSDGERKVLIYSYGHCWMKPWQGYEPTSELQDKATTDEMRQLLHASDAYPTEYQQARRRPKVGGTEGKPV